MKVPNNPNKTSTNGIQMSEIFLLMMTIMTPTKKNRIADISIVSE